MKNEKTGNRLIRATGVIIGDVKFNHKIKVVGDDRPAQKIASEFLKRQYPKRFKDIIDIEGEQLK